ncbi:MAG: glycosyltransferase family 2 protein [Devosia sp.]
MSFEPGRDQFASPKPQVSVVVPFLDEADSLASLHTQIKHELDAAGISHQVILVNDGSSDGSEAVCRDLALRHPNVILINFRTNFGKSAALSAGFHEAVADIVITMDADLQDSPAELPRFIAAIEAGADVVCGWKKERHDPVAKTAPSKLFNAVVNRTFGLKLNDHNCGFKAYRAEALVSLNLYGELHRFVPALLHARGFRITELAIQHYPRRFGHSKFGASRLVKGALDLMTVALTTRYATRPGHIFGALGLIMLTAGGLCLSYLTCLWLIGAGPIGDRPLLFLGMLLMLFGGQLISTGLIAELVLSRSIAEADKYAIRDRVGGVAPSGSSILAKP